MRVSGDELEGRLSEKRILVLTLSFGSGHIRAAQSVARELVRQMPADEIRLVDALENCSPWFRAFYVWPYWAMIRYAPSLWKRFFESRLKREDEFTAPVWIWKKGCKQVFAEIETFRPDAIIACEVGASEIAVIARREKFTNAEIVNVLTDFETEPIWIKPEISAFAVASEAVKYQLQNWGADPETIKICGIPLDESFDNRHDARKTRSLFHLDTRQIVLLMGGGMGPTRMSEVAALLIRDGQDLQIVALPAKDAKARAGLEALEDSATVSLCIVGWTNSVAELMQAADVLATKPGGLTLSEAAACGVPLVLFDAIPGTEETNARWFAKQGAGIQTRGSKETAAEILRLLVNQHERMKLAANIKKLAQTGSSEKIVGVIRETLERVPIVESVYPASSRFSAYRKMFLAACKTEAPQENSFWKTAEIKNAENVAKFTNSIFRTEIK